MAGTELPSRAIRDQIAGALHILVHTSRLTDGSRKVVSVSEITGMENDIITIQDIFKFQQVDVTADGKIVGSMQPTGAVPKFVLDLQKRGIKIDLNLFKKRV